MNENLYKLRKKADFPRHTCNHPPYPPIDPEVLRLSRERSVRMSESFCPFVRLCPSCKKDSLKQVRAESVEETKFCLCGEEYQALMHITYYECISCGIETDAPMECR